MTKELETLDYEDSLVLFNSSCEQYGARQVLVDFRDAFPDMFKEVEIQIERLKPQPKVAALLRP